MTAAGGGRHVPYDVGVDRLTRDLRRLPASIGNVRRRGDIRTEAYLSRRLVRARRLAHRLGIDDLTPGVDVEEWPALPGLGGNR